MNSLLLLLVFAIAGAAGQYGQLNKNPPTFAPGAFTYKLPPLNQRTFAPWDLAETSRRPHPPHHHSHGTPAPQESSSSKHLELFHITDSPQALIKKFPPVNTRGTYRPPSELIGHFPTSSAPHFTKKSQNELYDPITWKPIRITWKPVDLAASKKPRFTHPPKEELGKHHTFAPGVFTDKFTLPPIGKKTFALKEELSHHGEVTKVTVAPTADGLTKKDKGSFITENPNFTHQP
ncbi:Protein CBG05720 [Caenorhabditis briggsae]|uniref:Protein CBG05720 n=1 Tax=Caenorhabditis briggsae TaxID=6238 RepID=A8X1T2_CAEBR|nr:Protein CBG05720 [Caenorhabditis briggsae]CAP26592.1 Protein CBG05720 [Caenorhabditis briggsae]